MLNNLKKNKRIDGEIRFLACDSTQLNKGIGSKLLREFESRSKNKNVFLFTDDKCNYKFYEYKNYNKVDERDIVFKIYNKDLLLKCFLYYKEL